ncbi:MAG: efflux RND transporter periplasmic adaptor subunit [Opitutaceae bacterium]|nr:efflux RND transporter periplasmic adaptor subunit [Cephaloticoccus sp.]MCP5530806.1 efflux RND transporter periplasmic adaptor subunit [Opitutaceae bacterium]
MLKKLLLSVGGFTLIVLVLGATKASQVKTAMAVSHAQPPTSVTTKKAQLMGWRPTASAIGTLSPIKGITVSADADGVLVAFPQDNGAFVQEGDIIARLDTSVEEAQLAAAQARRDLATLQRDRATDLLSKNTISQSDADTATAQLLQAEAEVAALQAQIAKKTVRAPFSGRLGIRHVNLGQFIGRGAPLVSLQKLDELFVDFSVPQRVLPRLEPGREVTVLVDAFPGREFTAEVTAINVVVDDQTRNIAVQATLENPQDELRPGMFVQIKAALGEEEEIVAIPATSVHYASYGNSVFIVENMKDAEGKEYLGVRQSFVTLGATRGDYVGVTSGVKAGEVVVTSGVFKLRNAQAVQINNDIELPSSPTPEPANT